MAYFKAHPDAGVTRPDQIAVVGDRLSTDIMMANMMGSYGVWVRDGVTGRGFVSHHPTPSKTILVFKGKGSKRFKMIVLKCTDDL